VNPADVASRYLLWILNSMLSDDLKVMSALRSQTDKMRHLAAPMDAVKWQGLNTYRAERWLNWRRVAFALRVRPEHSSPWLSEVSRARDKSIHALWNT